MKYYVSNTEIGLLFSMQIFKKVLTVGEYTFFSRKKRVLIINKKNALEKSGIEVKTLGNNEVLQNMLTTISVKESEIVFHYVDGLFYEVLTSGIYSFFKDLYSHTFATIDARNIILPNTIDYSVLESKRFQEINNKQQFISSFIVDDGFVGILKVNGKIEKILNTGKYYFITCINEVNVKCIDLRNQALQIGGQELLTKDKVTLRMNFALTYKIIDPLKASTTFDNFIDQLYLLMQLTLREYVSTKSLDELLAEKHEIGRIILEAVKSKEQDFGAIFVEAGLKDIILPGDIKEILNTILIAEKKALANVITRREETASTRSLLNTAKLMEENTTLYKLKELEYLERICDKVGNITLSSNSGIMEQLSQILKVK